MADKRVRIAHDDGRTMDVPKRVFDRRFAGEGFTITANADGSAYEAPKPRSSTKGPATKVAPRRRDRSAAARKGQATKAAGAAAASQAIDSSAPDEPAE